MLERYRSGSLARYQESRTYPKKSADDCFAVAQTALQAAGFEVWKTRPIAWLALGKQKLPGDTVNANMMARPDGQVTLSIGGDYTPPEIITSLAQAIFRLLKPA